MHNHEKPQPSSSPRQELIKKRDDLLMDLVSGFQRELSSAIATGNFLTVKGHWQEIKNAVEDMEEEHHFHWGKTLLAVDPPSDPNEEYYFLRFPEMATDFQKQLAYAFGTGNFTLVKKYCRSVKEKLEQMEKKYKEEAALSNGQPPPVGRAQAVNRPKEENGANYRPE